MKEKKVQWNQLHSARLQPLSLDVGRASCTCFIKICWLKVITCWSSCWFSLTHHLVFQIWLSLMTAVEAPLSYNISMLTNNAMAALDSSPQLLELQLPALQQLEPRAWCDTLELLWFSRFLIPALGDARGKLSSSTVEHFVAGVLWFLVTEFHICPTWWVTIAPYISYLSSPPPYDDMWLETGSWF